MVSVQDALKQNCTWSCKCLCCVCQV